MKRAPVLLGCLAVIAGCDAGSTSGPVAEPVEPSPRLLVPGGADHFYDEGDTITIVAHFSSGAGAPSNVISAAQSAASRWNNQVLSAHTDSLPHLKPTVIGGPSASGTIARIVYADNCIGSNCGYCGSFNGEVGGVREIQLQRRDLGDPCGGLGRVVDDLTGVIVHELSHVLGFAHQSESGTEWCVTNVPDEGSLNPHPCRWEQQSVYAAYEIRNSDPLPGVPIASQIVILPDPDTVLTGSSSTIRAYGLVGPEPSENVDAGGEPGLPWVLPPDTMFVDVDWDDLNSPFFTATKIDTLGRARIDGVQIGQGLVVGEQADQANGTVATAYPWGEDTAAIVVQSASGLNPCFEEEYAQTWRSTDQYLMTSCGSTGANIQYRWRFRDGGPWTSFSPDTIHEFFGHSSADTHMVTVEVKNTSTGATEQFSREFTVISSVMSMSGPTYVTNKQLKTYESNWSGHWYERYDPQTLYDWYLALWGPDTVYTRIWPAGDYTRRLRVERIVGSFAGRDWLDVVVCHESIPGCGAPMWTLPREDESERLALFGGGPWIAVGDDIVRFYDLTGAHEQGSPFADATWLDAKARHRAVSADGRASLAWEVVAATADTRAVEFEVDGVAGPYTFGLALDPDLGKSPADDNSGFDSASDVLLVFDGTDAMGFALRTEGRSDIVAVKQYGAREFAPRDPEELREASQQAGVILRQDADDVQFFVTGSEVSGTHRWTLLMARDEDPSAVVAKLLAMIK